MKKIKFIVALLFLALAAHANDDDLFEDGVFADFEEMEIDESFPDDFTDIEESGDFSGGGSVGALVAHPHEMWDVRDVTLRRERSISIGGGNTTIAGVYHMTIFPQFRFELWQVSAHLGLPLHLPVYDSLSGGNSFGEREKGFVSPGTFILPRKQDFRSAFDAQRVLRHLEVARPFDPYFLRLSRSHAITLGQGVLVKELVPSGLYDQDYLFASGHATFDGARLDGFVGPLLKAEMVGLNLRFAPIAKVNTAAFLQGLNIDLSYVGDLNAPNYAMTNDDGLYALDEERRLIERAKGTAQGFSLGVASEYYPISWFSMTPYLAYGHMFLGGLVDQDSSLPSTNGGGFHFGHDAKISFMTGARRSLFLFRSEGRFFSHRYWPGYFGSSYMVDRITMAEPSGNFNDGALVTKSQYLGTSSDNQARFGFLFELGYALDDNFSASVGYENAKSLSRNENIAAMRKFHFRTNLSTLDILRFNLGYEVSFIEEMKYLFDFSRSRALVSLGGQLRLMPNLYFDAWAKHSFGINDMSPSSESSVGERASLNFGLGLELAMTF